MLLPPLAQSMRAAPPAGGIPLWAVIAILALAAALFIIGAWLVWSGPRSSDAPDHPPNSMLGRLRARLSPSSRAAIGLTLILVAYHGAAWLCPFRDRLLMVSLHYWWIVAGAAVLVIGLSLLADKAEGRGHDDPDEP